MLILESFHYKIKVIKEELSMKIKDIANELHLSVSTVSKALNGAFDVSKETKELFQVLKHSCLYYSYTSSPLKFANVYK